MESSEIVDVLKPIDYDNHPRRYHRIRIVVVSDTHDNHKGTEIADGDILIHCGDFTNIADWNNVPDGEVPQSVRSFNKWLGKLPHRYKIVICGNHEIGFGQISTQKLRSEYLTNCIYLKDELIEIEGISIYGCPWPFHDKYRSKWSSVPSHIDILITHVPPETILDLAYRPKKASKGICPVCHYSHDGPYGHRGSNSLQKELVERIQPKVHCFGHVHDQFGYQYHPYINQTLFINAAAKKTKRSFQFNFYRNSKKY